MIDDAHAGKTILLVEDNEELNQINARALELEGYRVVTALTLGEARARLDAAPPDVIVLDVLLPDGNGVDFCQEIRPRTSAPILFLTALGGYQRELDGLRAGGDDYLVKPFDLELLMARVEAFLRRDALVREARSGEVIRRGALTLNVLSGHAYVGGVDLLLRRKEFALLLALIRHENQALSKEQLYELVWNAPDNGDARVVKSHLSRVRQKLVDSGYDIKAVRGEGYRFGEV